MTEEQQVTLEKELKAARDQQEAQDKANAMAEEKRIAHEKELKAVRDRQEAAGQAAKKKSPRPPKKARPPVPRMALRPTRDKSLPG